MVPGSRERGRGRGRDDSECLLAKPPNAGAVPRHQASPCIQKCACGAHVVCVLWWCSRPGRAPRRTGIAAEAIRCCGAGRGGVRARANEVLCGALWPQATQQALQRVSVSLLHMLAADLGAAFGAAASVPPVGGARITAASALGLRAARCAGPSYEYANFDFDFRRKTARN